MSVKAILTEQQKSYTKAEEDALLANYYNKDYIDTYMAPLDTPTFIGVPKAPTAAAGTNTTQIATTAFVEQAKNTRVPVYGLGKNLLRNWYFVGGGSQQGGKQFPINQRGASSYTGSVYAIDGWKNDGQSTVTLNSSGISLPGGQALLSLIRISELISGAKYTISALWSNGLQTATGTLTIGSAQSQWQIATSTAGGTGVCAIRQFNPTVFQFAVWGDAVNTLTAVKLELGTEQTLCHNEGTEANPVWVPNELPNYEEELYRCMTSTADSSDTYANKILATGQEIAYVETGTTASRNYTAGQYISLNGLLYTADTAIASGTTFYVSGGNKNLTECVGGGFNSLSNVTNANVTFSNNVTGYTYQNEYHLSKSGNIVTANILMSVSSIAGMGTALCTAPAAFRPSVNRRIAAWLTYNNESRVDTVIISPNGEITTASGGYNVSGFIRIFGTYIL